MSTLATTCTTFEEYSHTTFRPDREWIDGGLRERAMGKWEHARLQFLLAMWLGQHEAEWQVVGATEQRVQVSSSPQRVRIPDLALIRPSEQESTITKPPVLVVEILSEDDSYSDTQERADDYRAMGIKTIWIIDPKTRTGRMCIDHETIGNDLWIKADVLFVPGTLIHVGLPDLFKKLDQ